MRIHAGLMLCLLAGAAHAGSGTLRVGSQVLVVGDSAARVVELLGKPTYKSRASSSAGQRGKTSGKTRRGRGGSGPGEQWQYRDGTRTVTIMVVDGKVSAIRDGGR
jgi:hypothetical protein